LKFDNNKICSIFPIDFLVFYDQHFNFFGKVDRYWADLKICLQVVFCQITSKNLSLCSWEITKKSFRWKGLKIFWKFGIFDKRSQGCNEVKNSMGLLQGPRSSTCPLTCFFWLLSHSSWQKYYKSVFFSQSCFWMIKFTVIPKTHYLALGNLAKLIFWLILWFKNLQDWKVNIFLSISGEK
jgi:hypothetical protein